MIFIFISPCFSAFFDNYGVEYSNDRKILVKTLDSIPSNYIIPASCEIILGGTLSSNSAFANCANKLKNISFEEGSNITSIYISVFSASSIEFIDFSNCKLLTAINYTLFYKCHNLKNVTLPPNLLILKTGCFMDTPKLYYIKLPDSCTTIEGWHTLYGHVFSGGLSQIDISVDSQLNSISNDAFIGTKLTYFFIPQYITKLIPSAFTSVPIKKFEIDPRNQNFHTDGLVIYSGSNNYTLHVVSSTVTGEYVLPEFVTTIFDQALRGVPITNLTIHDKLQVIKTYAFSGTKISNFTCNSLMTTITSNCFSNNRYLESFNFTNNIIKIESYAFNNCPNLKNIVLPDSLKEIGDNVFSGCTSLTYIKIPKSVNSIGSGVFKGCSQELVVDANDNDYCTSVDGMFFVDNKSNLIDFFNSDINRDLTIPTYCLTIKQSTFQNKLLRNLNFVGPNSMTIENSAFEGSTIKSISFTNVNLTSLGIKTFYNCKYLTSVTFNENCVITEIPQDCFNSCPNLETITLPSKITRINDYAFYRATKISNIGIESTNLISIGIKAFFESGIRTALLPSSTNSIGDSCFESSDLQTFAVSANHIPINCLYNCVNLETLTLREGVQLIDQYALGNCNFQTVMLPQSIVTISESSFINCASLTTIKIAINSNLQDIRGGAFVGCKLLKTITLLDGEERFLFENGALMSHDQTILFCFLPYSDVRTFVVPMKMDTINPRGFYKCEMLSSILFNGNYIKKIGTEAFKGCKNLNFVFVSSPSIKELGERCFDDCPLLKSCGSFSIPASLYPIFKSRGVTEKALQFQCTPDCATAIQRAPSQTCFGPFLVFIAMYM